MLSERRAQILDLVAESYINSAHPVPSSFIAEKLAVSSATVRNEFSSLEEAGYLQQPHTSSGRIPTALGFRPYTRSLLPPETPHPRQLRLIREHLQGKHGDSLFESIVELAANLSGYAVVVSLPADESLHAVEIHLSLLSSELLLAVIVLENGLVRQLPVSVRPAPSDDVLPLAESSLRQLAVPLVEMPQALMALARRESTELGRTLEALARAWPALTPPRLFYGGLGKLLSEPESRNPDFLRLIVEHVETPPRDEIGSELELQFDEVTARIRTRLNLGPSHAGLTVVGPSRMRYREALQVARGISESIKATSN